MSLLDWLFHEKQEFDQASAVLERAKIDLESLRLYVKFLPEKLAAAHGRDLGRMTSLMGMYEKEDETASAVERDVAAVIAYVARHKGSRQELARLEGVLSTLKRMHALLLAQLEILRKSGLSSEDWEALEAAVVEETRALYEISARRPESVHRQALRIQKRYVPRAVAFLSEEDVLRIHDEALRKWGGMHGIRDRMLLDSAVNRPKQGGFGMGDFYATLFDKAAALLYSLLQNQPFLEGNTRTAVYSTAEFLRRNGVRHIEINGLWVLAKSLAKRREVGIGEIRTRLMRLAA